MFSCLLMVNAIYLAGLRLRNPLNSSRYPQPSCCTTVLLLHDSCTATTSALLLYCYCSPIVLNMKHCKLYCYCSTIVLLLCYYGIRIVPLYHYCNTSVLLLLLLCDHCTTNCTTTVLPLYCCTAACTTTGLLRAVLLLTSLLYCYCTTRIPELYNYCTFLTDYCTALNLYSTASTCGGSAGSAPQNTRRREMIGWAAQHSALLQRRERLSSTMMRSPIRMFKHVMRVYAHDLGFRFRSHGFREKQPYAGEPCGQISAARRSRAGRDPTP